MQNKILEIFNGRIITPEGIIANGKVLVDGGKIVEVGSGFETNGDFVKLDARGQYVSPGFIDIHVHGGGGHDFMDGTEEAFLGIAETHARHGTTAMLPTTLSCSHKELLNTLKVYESAAKKNQCGSVFLGMHLEGPYFAMNQRGAQDPRFIRDPVKEEYQEILSSFVSVKRWSVAPELNGALEMGRVLRSKGILASIAHTDAIYEEVEASMVDGYTLVTHLYSGMSGVTRKNAMRFAGVIESAFLLDELDVEIIADGVHLPAPLLKLVYKIKGPDRIALITDAMRAAGMPPGESVLGNKENGLKVIVEDGVAKLPDRSSFAGSVATADRLVRTMMKLAGIPLVESVKMMTTTPARILGLSSNKGRIAKGMDSDLVFFDDNIQVSRTIIGGKIVYDRPN